MENWNFLIVAIVQNQCELLDHRQCVPRQSPGEQPWAGRLGGWAPRDSKESQWKWLEIASHHLTSQPIWLILCSCPCAMVYFSLVPLITWNSHFSPLGTTKVVEKSLGSVLNQPLCVCVCVVCTCVLKKVYCSLSLDLENKCKVPLWLLHRGWHATVLHSINSDVQKWGIKGARSRRLLTWIKQTVKTLL